MKDSSFLQKLKTRLTKKLFGSPFPWKVKTTSGYKSYRAAILQSRELDELQLVHAPALGKSSVYIFSISLGALLGEVDKRTAKKLLALFGEGFCLDGEIYQIDEENEVLTVLVYDTSDFAKGEVFPMLLK